MGNQFKNPLRKIIYLSFFTFFILLVIYGIAKYIELPGLERSQDDIALKIELITIVIWEFLKPILQVTLLLVIVEWILDKFGVDFKASGQVLKWNIQTVIAIIIIGAFALAALTNLSAGLGYLKDLSLVVVGFYFGSQKKPNPTETHTTTGSGSENNS